MRKYDTVLFDLDGTVTDSKPGILRCIKLALDYYKIPYTEQILNAMVGPPFRLSMKQFFGIEDMEIVEGMIKIYRAEYEVEGWKECSVYAGVEKLLKDLNDNGFTVGMATSKPIKFTRLMMDGLDLAKYFKFIGGASSDSTRESKSDVINYALDALEITDKSKVIMIGDRLYDIDGAKLSGVDSIGILWGYGDREELSSHGADYLFGSPAEVFNFLTK